MGEAVAGGAPEFVLAAGGSGVALGSGVKTLGVLETPRVWVAVVQALANIVKTKTVAKTDL